MKTLVFSLLTLLLAVTSLRPGSAQTKVGPKSGASASAAESNEQFVMHNGQVRLRQGRKMASLSRNVVLPNGTKVDYKSGTVEYATGKKATLQEGDYVTLTGEVVLATPLGGAPQGENTLPVAGKSDVQADKKRVPGTSPAANELPMLLTRKIQLLTDKINMMVPDPTKQDAINKINQQLLTLEAQIGR